MNASWIAIDLMDFAVQTEEAMESPEKALKWLRSFRDTLLMEGRNARPMPWAVKLLEQADMKMVKKSIARMHGQVLKLCGKDCDLEAECIKRYGERYTELVKKLTADAPHREVGDDVTDTGNRALLESGTSANNSKGDAVSSDAKEVCTNRESVVAEPTTISTHSEAPQGQRAGENSVRRVEKVSTFPVRSSGPAKHKHGEFGNVMLTDDEYAKLCEKCPDADALVTELDQYIESQGKTKKYKSHYATLLNWSRRKAQESKPKQGYMTSDDISKKNYEESKARLEAMFSKGRKTA